MSDPESLATLGWNPHWEALAAESPGRPGRVVRQDRGWVQVATADGVVSAETRSTLTGAPVVGDWVAVDDGIVVSVFDRQGALRRLDPRGEGEQVLVANLDLVLIVLGLDRPVKDGRVQRTVAQSWDSGATPVAVLTKADAVEAPLEAVRSLSENHPGIEVLPVSSLTGAGIDALRARIRGWSVVLVGESGAGKSTLLNALAGSDHAATGAVREFDAKGRHTTTHRELFVLEDGTIVVDTPGVRAMGLFADVDAIDATFPDVEELSSGCRFSDCSHHHEPGCAVIGAVDQGSLPVARLEAYRELLAEVAWASRPDHERRPRGRRPDRNGPGGNSRS